VSADPVAAMLHRKLQLGRNNTAQKFSLKKFSTAARLAVFCDYKAFRAKLNPQEEAVEIGQHACPL
jgi:hypothetical protein